MKSMHTKGGIMKLSELEEIVGIVALDFFNYKNPGFSPLDNPKAVQTCIDDTAFVINKFIGYFNKKVEGELNE